MNPGGFLAAFAAGCFGALAWAGVAYYANLEIGYLAWGIGGLVGFCGFAAGARGATAGATCAAIALVSILAGKMFTVHLLVSDTSPAKVVYVFLEPHVEDFSKARTDRDYRNFMAKAGFSMSETANGVTAEELTEFKTSLLPVFQEMVLRKPTSYEQWSEGPAAQAYVATLAPEISYLGIVTDSLDLFDAIFFTLGVVTAFQLVNRAEVPKAKTNAPRPLQQRPQPQPQPRTPEPRGERPVPNPFPTRQPQGQKDEEVIA